MCESLQKKSNHCAQSISGSLQSSRCYASKNAVFRLKLTRVEVRTSTLPSDVAGDGLFAKVLIAQSQVAALLNGVRVRPGREGDSDGESFEHFSYR